MEKKTKTATTVATPAATVAQEEAPVTSMKLNNLMTDAETAAQMVCDAINNGKSTDEVRGLKGVVKARIDSYNRELARTTYVKWKDEKANPIEKGVRARTVSGAKTIQFKVNPDTGDTVFKVTNNEKYWVDLTHIEEALGAAVFHEEDWLIKCQALAYMVANAIHVDICGDKIENYGVKEAARTFQFGDKADMKSKTSMVKAMQKCVDSILFIPDKNGKNSLKMCNAHWSFIERASAKYTRQKCGVMTIASYSEFIGVLIDMMAMTLEGKDLKAEVSSR